MIRFLDWRNKLHSLSRSNFRSKANRARGRQVGTALKIEQFEDRRLLTISALGLHSAYVEGVPSSQKTVAEFSDTDGNTDPSLYGAQINWGDGTTTSGTVKSIGLSFQFDVIGDHTYADEGSHIVSVDITDTDGESANNVTSTATVAENDTLVAGTAAVAATEGTTFTGTVATFSDTSYPGNLASDFTATVDWGDGTTDVGTVSGGSGTFTVSGSHLYADEGSNPLAVTLTDDAPGTASATATGTATVADNDTLVAGTSITAGSTEGATFSGTVATFTDTTYAGNLPGDFSASINWGDGTVSPGTATGSAGSFTIGGSHIYSDEGTKTVTVVLSDDTPGTATGTATATINVATVPIVATAVAVSGFEFTPLNNVTVATFTHANGLEPASGFTATIDWGDGTSSSGTVTLSGTNYTVSGSHTYTDEKSYAVSVSVADDAVSATVASHAAILEQLLPGGTRGTADQRFISEVYRDLLNRAIDPSGLASWTAVLAQGTSRSAIVNELEASTEFKNDEVNSIYEQYLHRAVDASGLQTWSPMLAAGKTVEQVAAMIVGSQEYFAVRGHGTNDGFIDAIYEDALGRAPDAGGKSSFEHELAAGVSRGTVASQIFGSIEYKQTVVAKVFANLLDRPAEPSALAGDGQLLQQGMTDEQLIAAVASSTEYYNKVSS